MGFIIGQLQADAMKPHLKAAKHKPSGDLLLDANALDAFYKRTLPQSHDMAKCDCGGTSPAELDECPYCGFEGCDDEEVPGEDPDGDGEGDEVADPEDEAEAAEEKPAPKKPPVKAKKAPKKAAKEKAAPASTEKAEGEEKPPTAKKKTKKAAAKEKPAKEKPAKEKPAKEKPAKKSKKKADPKTEVVDKATADALATKLPSHLSVLDLDRECKVIGKSAKKMGEEYYKAGVAFKKVADQELWKLREDKRGGRAYTNFGQWAKTELATNASGAYQMIRVVENFSEKQILEIGPSKLRLAMTLPKDKAEKLLKEGGNLREMSDRAKELKDGKAPKKAPAAPSNPVTVAVIAQDIELPMQVRSGAAGAPVGEDTEPATSLDQDPWAKMEMENDTTMYFRLAVNGDTGEIILCIETRRGNEA